MLSTVFVLVYVSIAGLSMRMTLKEYQAQHSGGRLGLLTGILACLFWPVMAFFLLLMLNLTATPAQRFEPTT